MRYLGIDWGEKRIGLAICDDEVGIVSPFNVVNDIDDVVCAIEEEEVDFIVVGEPLTMKNREDFMKKRVDEFIKKLKKRVDKKIVLHDERLSSKGADSLPGDKKSKARRDAVAAMLILEGYLDSLSTKGANKVL